MAKVHIGKRIKEVFEQSHYTTVEFASNINMSRTNVYDVFTRDTIDTGLLQKISQILDHDFFSYYSNELAMIKEEGRIGYARRTDLITSLGDELKMFKKKIVEMEEKYETLKKLNKLQEEKLESLKKRLKK
ncbi:MAG: hypothetical protein ACXVNN_05240 [Bacteroidia bacterium]